ncbi:MAG: NADH-quinone oxidoreductase subunit L, partial [Pirellulaceae bacterium]
MLPGLLGVAVLLPLCSFFVIWLFAKWLGKSAALVAVGAIGGACLLSFVALFGIWLPHHWPPAAGHQAAHGEQHEEHHEASPSDQHAPAGQHSQFGTRLAPFYVSFAQATGESHAAEDHSTAVDHSQDHSHAAENPSYTGEFYTLGEFGPLRITISYYIDSLTICMFCMVTLIATLIHCYAIGYMSDELSDVTDHEVTLSNGHHLHRPGRFPRFFQYLSLF